MKILTLFNNSPYSFLFSLTISFFWGIINKGNVI